MRNFARTKVKIAALLGLCLALAGCGTTYPEDLRALRADPMAGVELARGEIVHEIGTEASVMASKRQFATYSVRYRPEAGVTLQELREEAIAAAADSGWELSEPDETSVDGTKQLETGEARISIASAVVDGDERLVIILEHEFDHPG
jgi:hypothetical protein